MGLLCSKIIFHQFFLCVMYKLLNITPVSMEMEVSIPSGIPTKELQSLYISTMSVTDCDNGVGGGPPPVLFDSRRCSANFCLASLHMFLHLSLTSFTVLLVLPTAFTFSVIPSQIVCFFWLVHVLENLLSKTGLAFTSLWIMFISIILKFWLLALLGLEQTSAASMFTQEVEIHYG